MLHFGTDTYAHSLDSTDGWQPRLPIPVLTGMLLFGTDGGVQSLLLSPSSRVWKTCTATLALNLYPHSPT